MVVRVLVGAALIAAGAQIAVPMVPVPTTLQTLAVVGVALWRGPAVGALAAATYLGLVLVGLPVLSGGQPAGGSAFLGLATAGYVMGFVPAAFVVGWLAARWRSYFGWFGAGLVGHAVVLAVGVPVLAVRIGWADAVTKGLAPFLLAAVVKSAVAASIWWAPGAREPRS